MQIINHILIGSKVFGQRFGQRIDRPAIGADLIHRLANGQFFDPIHLDHDDRFGQANHLIILVFAAFNRNAVALDLKKFRALAQFAPRQQLKAGLCGVIGISLGLAGFDHLKNAAQRRIALFDRNARCAQPFAQVRLTRLIGHRNDACIAHLRRVHMLIGTGIFSNRTGVQPGLMGKSRGPHISRLPRRHPVENIIKQPRSACKPL